jgi:sigma-E factor negative regulatory protein RseB
MSEKYVTGPGDGAPVVAGRPTDVVEISEEGTLRTRLYLDTETGLLLRREQLDESGRPERMVEFRHLTLGQSTPAPTVPPKASALLTSQAPSLRPITMDGAPEVLGDGFARLGVYRREAVVQVHYSDGLFELSVFEEAGRLDDDSLPDPGRRVAVGDEDATLYAWPGGHVLVWQAGPVVRTVVSDAPSQELLEAAQALPGPGWGRPSLLDKIRRAGAALVDPIE